MAFVENDESLLSITSTNVFCEKSKNRNINGINEYYVKLVKITI